MKRRYFSIIALAFVFGIATLFTSCKSEEESQAEADAAAAEIEALFNDALNEVDTAVVEATTDTAVVEAATDTTVVEAVEETTK